MKSFQATAIRTCGAATLLVVLISLVEIGQPLLGVDLMPGLQMSLGVGVLVSLTAFVVANVPRITVADGVCLSSVGVIAVLSALYVYKAGIANLAFLDIVLVLFGWALLGNLCWRVRERCGLSVA